MSFAPFPYFDQATANVLPWGDRWKLLFYGTWSFGDSWTVTLTYNGTAYTFGKGQVTSASSPETINSCFTFKNRVFLACGAQFNFSDNSLPTAWESQDAGAGYVLYLSQLGSQDSIQVFNQLQGRLSVFATKSIQIWSVDADPSKFSLVQQLDNIGTIAPLSVQNLGDYDVIFLDSTGLRSLRTMEVTLNSIIDDIGSPIDNFVQADIKSGNASTACGIVDPLTKNYWLYINSTIYVLSRHRSSKISAWSTYKATDDAGTSFTPQKFVVYNKRVYCRGTSAVDGHDYLYLYGAADNATYDAKTQVTVTMPWLADKRPGMFKQWLSLDFVVQGKWNIAYNTDPKTAGTFPLVMATVGNAANPSDTGDSSYDIGTEALTGESTHICFQFQSQINQGGQSTTIPCILGSIAIHYNFSANP